ncbi:hypothetical protein JCM8208_001123 [Rhodotorula glutinis]
MIVRGCRTGFKPRHAAAATDVAAALAQLPPFLVPSFASDGQRPSRVHGGGPGSSAGQKRTVFKQASAAPTSTTSSSSRRAFICGSSLTTTSSRSRTPATTCAPHPRRASSLAAVRPPPPSSARPAGKGKERAPPSEGHVAEGQDVEEGQETEGAGSAVGGSSGADSARSAVPAPSSQDAQRNGLEREAASSGTSTTSRAVDTPAAPPTSRKELMRIATELPRRPTRDEFRDARARLKAFDALDDTAVVRALGSAAIRARLDNDALRLAHECAKLVAARRPAEAKAAIVAMYEQLIAALERARRWDSVVAFTNDALALGVISHFVLARRIRALHESRRYVDAIATFSLFSCHELEPDWRDYDEVISAHLLNGELAKAQDLLADKVRKGLRTTAQTCLALIGGMVQYGGNRVMEERLLEQASDDDLAKRRAMRQDPRVLNKVLSVRAARGALADALAILPRFDLAQYPSDLVEAILSLSPPSPSADDPRPSAFADPHWRPPPDASTIVTLVGLVLRQQQPQLARRLLVSSLGAGIRFNDFLAAAVVRTLLAQHNLDSAASFVEALSQGKATLGGTPLPALEPSVKVYELLLGGMLRYRGIPGANACFERLSSSSGSAMQVTEGMTRALVDHLALDSESEVGVSSSVLLKVKQMTSNKTRPSVAHLNTLLRAAWTRERRWQHDLDGPETPIENEFPMPDEPLPPERTKLDRAPPRPEASPSSSSSSSSQYVPREAELLVSSGGRHESSVSRLRASLADRDVRHDRDTSRHILRNDYLIRYIAAKWDYLQSHVVDLGIRPSFHHVAVLMRAYLRLGDAKGARLAMQYAVDDLGLEPHQAYYTTLIGGLARLGEYGAAVSVYADFRKTGLAHDRNLYAALAMLYARQRDVKGVERVFALMQEQVRARALVPQLQAQSLRLSSAAGRTAPTSAASSSASPPSSSSSSGGVGGTDIGAGLPSTLLTPYDPTLDALFLTILYRTLVSTNEYLAAQQRVHDAFARGLVPDRLLLHALQRTRKWIKWKENASRRVGGVRTSAVGRGRGAGAGLGGNAGEGELSLDELAEVKHLNALNITHARKMLRRMKPVVEKKELRSMLDYWRRAEKEPRPLGLGSRRDEEDEDDDLDGQD